MNDELSDLCGEISEQPSSEFPSLITAPRETTPFSLKRTAEMVGMGIAVFGMYTTVMIDNNPTTLYRSLFITPVAVWSMHRLTGNSFLEEVRYTALLATGSAIGYVAGQLF